MRRFHLGKAVGIVILVIIGVFVFGSIVMVLWNSVMPAIFRLPLINFWQALTLFCLAKILFGGFRGGPRGQWKRDKLKDAWKNMTPEQKDKLNSEWGRRCRRPFESEAPFSAGMSGKSESAGTTGSAGTGEF